MASVNKFLCFLVLFSCLCTLSNSLNVFKPYQKPSDCKENAEYFQYFSTVQMECKNCPEKKTSQKTSADGYSCECQPGYRYIFNFGGDNVTCEKCGVNQVRSMDGFNCVDCTTNCDSCPTGELPFEREVNGAWNGGAVKQRTCIQCQSNTSLNTAGDRCERCSSFLSLTPSSNCQCVAPNYYQSGGVCFPAPKPTTISYELPLLDSNIRSSYLEENLLAAYLMCSEAKNTTACQILGNLCVLTYYEYTQPSSQADSACNMYKKITGDLGLEWPDFMPWLLYASSGRDATLGDIILADNTFTTAYTITPLSYLKFVVARYSIGGQFLGFSNVTNGLLQLCTDTSERLDALYTFGTSYSQTCNIKAIDLWDTTKYPMEFFDIYIEFEDNGVTQLYAVPIKVNNLVYNNREVNTEGDSRNYILARRFFLVDNVAGTEATSTTNTPSYVRYLKTLNIIIRLDDSKTNGRIYPPYIEVTYDAVSLTTAQEGGYIQPYVGVIYSFGQGDYRRNFRIAVGTLSVLAVLYAAYRSWVWSKRSGRFGMDFASLVSFVFYVAGSLANIFFVISFGIAFYFLVFFKRQTAVVVFHIDGIQYEEWLALFASAFALKSLHVIHMIFIHCTVDLFLIDWERPRSGAPKNPDSTKKVESNPVSIWRTYFVANEWNEIQTTRKINHIFQIFATIFFLVVVGFQNVATKDPDGNVNKSSSSYQAPHSVVFRYAVSACIYLLVAFVQWIFFTFIYERFVEDKVRQFIDLCSMSNISVFIMAHAQFGYYIHGRSVHGKADTSMKEMFDMMKREEEDLCGQRGLLPGTEQQTFLMSLPRKLRLKYEQVMLPVALEGAGGIGAGAGKTSEKQVEAYTIVNKFLSAFVDHSLKDLDYVVKDKTFLESLMDTEFLDTTEKGIFFNDNGHSFDDVLFYGNEGILIVFETLLFCIVDLICTNFVLAGIITYVIIEIVALIRDSGGRKNLAKKTLVDERFLI